MLNSLKLWYHCWRIEAESRGRMSGPAQKNRFRRKAEASASALTRLNDSDAIPSLVRALDFPVAAPAAARALERLDRHAVIDALIDGLRGYSDHRSNNAVMLRGSSARWQIPIDIAVSLQRELSGAWGICAPLSR